MRKSQAARMAEVSEFTRKDLTEINRHLEIQLRIWRSLFVIISHHSWWAPSIMKFMVLNAMLVGDIDRLERWEKLVTAQAQKCGRFMGVFQDEGERCYPPLKPEEFWALWDKTAEEAPKK